MAGERLARRIKNQATNPNELSDLIYGVVTSASPLKIQVDSRFEVSSEHLILSSMVQRKTVTITIDGKSGTGVVFEALKTGERVKMLRVSSGQKYYVLERG
ncbi:DUF2577 domain-containing protein [Enterococcus italicus]|uniref:DUF2577 domain-containing protein n=1 Tax=Enterococcus italicus TaxID=246144 RepID=UPI00207497C1|nr:DUF2577 domain-containing protein [Enterococcus italicus]